MEQPYTIGENITGIVNGGTLRGRVSTVFYADAPSYNGAHEVKPAFSVQTLPTKDTTVKQDITVHPILVNKTANAAGGNTIVIGD